MSQNTIRPSINHCVRELCKVELHVVDARICVYYAMFYGFAIQQRCDKPCMFTVHTDYMCLETNVMHGICMERIQSNKNTDAGANPARENT